MEPANGLAENHSQERTSPPAPVKKTFKSQSLNSLFRKPAPQATTVPSSQASNSSPKIGERVMLAKMSPKPQSPAGSPAGTPVLKSVTTLSTASGQYKLATMKRESKPGSGGSSASGTPAPEKSTVWKKPEEPKSESPAGSPVVSTSVPALAAPPKDKEEQHEPAGEAKKEENEDDLVKRGIHLAQRLSTSEEAPKRQFSWAEDDDDDDDWPLTEIELKLQEELKKYKSQNKSEVKEEKKEKEPVRDKTAPWGRSQPVAAPVVPIGEQIKQLSEKKHQKEQLRERGHRPPPLPQNVPKYNYRLNAGHERDQFDPFDEPFHHPSRSGRFHDPDGDRYRYNDHERRYRTGVPPPRQELFNASSGQIESVNHGMEPRGRRYSMGRSLSPHTVRRPSPHAPPAPPAPVPAQAQAPPPRESSQPAQNYKAGGGGDVQDEAEYRKEQEEVMRQAREKARKRKEEELRQEQERQAAAKKKADELAARMKEKELQRKKEAEQKRELERQKREQDREKQKSLKKEVSKREPLKRELQPPPKREAPKRELPKREEPLKKDVPKKDQKEKAEKIEKPAKLEKTEKMEKLEKTQKLATGPVNYATAAKGKAATNTASSSAIAQPGERALAPPTNPKTERSTSTISIDENQALRTVNSVLGDEDKSDTDSLWNNGPSPSAKPTSKLGTTPSKLNTGPPLWNTPVKSQPSTTAASTTTTTPGNESSVWGSRFSSGLFAAKDDLVLLSGKRHERGHSRSSLSPDHRSEASMFWAQDKPWRSATSSISGRNFSTPLTTSIETPPQQSMTQSQPATPSGNSSSAAAFTPDGMSGRGFSRFFPSPQIDNGDFTKWAPGSPKQSKTHEPSHKPKMASVGDRDVVTLLENEVAVGRPRVILPKAANGHQIGNHGELPHPATPYIGRQATEIPFPPLKRDQVQREFAFDDMHKLQVASSSLELLMLVDEPRQSRVVLPRRTKSTSVPPALDLFPPIELPPMGHEQPVIHSGYYVDKANHLHKRESDIDHTKALSICLLRLPGAPERTVLKRDENNQMIRGDLNFKRKRHAQPK